MSEANYADGVVPTARSLGPSPVLSYATATGPLPSRADLPAAAADDAPSAYLNPFPSSQWQHPRPQLLYSAPSQVLDVAPHHPPNPFHARPPAPVNAAPPSGGS